MKSIWSGTSGTPLTGWPHAARYALPHTGNVH